MHLRLFVVGSYNKNIKVLIVEDEKISSIYLSILLNKLVQKVITVQNGIEAVNTVRNDSGFNLIRMNIKMSKTDGFQSTRQIRKINRDTVIIAQENYAFIKHSMQNALIIYQNQLMKKSSLKKLTYIFKTKERVMNLTSLIIEHWNP